MYVYVICMYVCMYVCMYMYVYYITEEINVQFRVLLCAPVCDNMTTFSYSHSMPGFSQTFSLVIHVHL